LSLLAATPFYCAIVDVDAFALLLLSAAGFVILADFLRREMKLAVSDGWILFYALSFTYSTYALGAGASWMEFLANQSALPWLVLGILQKRAWPGVGLVALFSVHQILGGHVEPTLSTSELLSLFAAGMSVARRSWLPFAIWCGGCVVSVVVVLPLLLPVIGGFLATSRAHGLTLQEITAFHVPALEFLPDVFAGSMHWLLTPYDLSQSTPAWTLGASAAAWCLVAAIVSRAKWQGLEVVTLGMMVLTALMVCRPVWLAEVMLHVPVLRSMRLPFREFLQFVFFLHLFVLVRPPGLPARVQCWVALFGACFFIVTTGYDWPPTFNPSNLDRQLILGGGAERFWKQLRPLLKPEDRLVVILPQEVYIGGRYDRAYSLLGTYNYAVPAGVVNASGYSPTVPSDQVYLKTVPAYFFGAYTPDQKAAVLAERPEVKFLTLESWEPLKITLSSRDGPTIDLTPHVPPGVAGVDVK